MASKEHTHTLRSRRNSIEILWNCKICCYRLVQHRPAYHRIECVQLLCNIAGFSSNPYTCFQWIFETIKWRKEEKINSKNTLSWIHIVHCTVCGRYGMMYELSTPIDGHIYSYMHRTVSIVANHGSMFMFRVDPWSWSSVSIVCCEWKSVNVRWFIGV